MPTKTKRSTGLRVFNALCASVLIFCGLYLLIAGLNNVAVAVLLCSTLGIAVPVVMSGVGVLEVFVGVLEAILDGILAIFEAIAGIFSGLFG